MSTHSAMIDYESNFKVEMNLNHSAWRQPTSGHDQAGLVKMKGYSILTTMNGYQWSGTSTMTRDELEVLSAWLVDYLRDN